MLYLISHLSKRSVNSENLTDKRSVIGRRFLTTLSDFSLPLKPHKTDQLLTKCHSTINSMSKVLKLKFLLNSEYFAT